ncbi:MAG: hypothetical protein A3F72_16700 [Bacteroidetes bacterium RIFCSPLOWO2_12_FULL_35_15]|nr:MAG: hypothetical protein A3F72_16700 [Bacteroidetes bacterium RIFCSPLOWO2_12_FULL_35_15]
MKTNKLILIAFTIAAVFLSTSCKKKIRGCTDPAATNYKTSANEEDGSCTFEGSVVLWYGQTTSDLLIQNGHSFLEYSIDYSYADDSDCSAYYTTAPNCGESGSVTVTKNLGNSSSKSFYYSVVCVGTDSVLWSGNLTFTAKTCTKHELHY